MDTNNDGQLTRSELVYIYRTIDVNRDIRDSHQEVVDWVRKNLDSICASQRKQIIKKISKEDKKQSLDSATLNRILDLYKDKGDKKNKI